MLSSLVYTSYMQFISPIISLGSLRCSSFSLSSFLFWVKIIIIISINNNKEIPTIEEIMIIFFLFFLVFEISSINSGDKSASFDIGFSSSIF